MSEFSMFQSPSAGAIGRTVSAAPTAVTFMIGTQQYGLPVANVFEVVPIPAMLILAGAPTYFIGVVNRRGRYLPILDGRILLGEPAQYDLDRYVIIAGRASANHEEHGTPLIGILVDQVCDVRMFQSESLTSLGADVAAPFLDSIARWAEHSVLLFNLDELLALVPSISVDVTEL